MIKAKITSKAGTSLEWELPANIHKLHHALVEMGIRKTPRSLLLMDDNAADVELTADSEIGNRLLLSLMYASGMRAQEVCDLTVGNILSDETKTILVITGKGKKTRRIRIADRCAVMLKEYLNWRGIALQEGRHVFSSQTHEQMTISCVEAIYKKHLKEAKRQNPSLFQAAGYSPHSMRHTCAMHMLEAGVPIMAIKNFLGHSSVTTTERYAELTQSTVDKHIQEWNQRWFGNHVDYTSAQPVQTQKNFIPSFLK